MLSAGFSEVLGRFLRGYCKVSQRLSAGYGDIISKLLRGHQQVVQMLLAGLGDIIQQLPVGRLGGCYQQGFERLLASYLQVMGMLSAYIGWLSPG